MEHKVTRSIYLAQAVSKFTNPPALSVFTLLSIASTKADDAHELIGWVAMILLFFVLIPAIYVYTRALKSGNHIKSVVDLTVFLKRHPIDILILALLPGLACLAAVLLLKAPTILISTITALLAVSIVAALFNTFYRVSFHLAAITTLIIMASRSWGPIMLVLLVIIPLIFWAKYYLHEHTIPQLAAGITVSLVVSLAVLYLFGQLVLF